jgi:(E)-4-hydroxy-3-methylbut-2-enyl-diphosphate synthase
MSYCASRFVSIRRPTREVRVGAIGIGGANPIRVQSMTTSDTQDIEATVRQSIALAEAGCEIVRITAPNVTAARCLKDIRARFTAAGFGNIPLVADIHFQPAAAMEAVEHVEKVRINPGNYADRKKFQVKEYSDADYARELERLAVAFSPLVKRARELGRSLRVGTNHGSLSDRIMNRYGDTPLGMVESALEFLLSMKASNPKVMIEAYRLLVDRMAGEGMHYPLHLGVTEAGDGEDGRIKSAIGIGSLLLDGLGDTIRVSLTEDSVYEIPVARAIADKAMRLWAAAPAASPAASIPPDPVDPFHFRRRETVAVSLTPSAPVGPEQPPRVVVAVGKPSGLSEALARTGTRALDETPAEALMVDIDSHAALQEFVDVVATSRLDLPGFVLHLAPKVEPAVLDHQVARFPSGCWILRRFGAGDESPLNAYVKSLAGSSHGLAAEIDPGDIPALAGILNAIEPGRLIVTLGSHDTLHPPAHAVGEYRRLAAALAAIGCRAPIWIRQTEGASVDASPVFLSRLIESSFLIGGLLCDGIGDLISIETEADPVRATRLAYNVLQGAGARISKTEFVACPSCGRTLFDLQTTTQRIRERTGHLKGVKIAIMGCIVNGPGEMADADFGYVGGAPGKINLYVGRQCVQYHVPQEQADERLVALIREHGKWIEPEPVAT